MVGVPYIRVLHPDFSESAADVWLEQNLIAVTSSIL